MRSKMKETKRIPDLALPVFFCTTKSVCHGYRHHGNRASAGETHTNAALEASNSR